MGVSRSGRFAAVTNYRGAHEPGAAESRGALVSRFLAAASTPGEYVNGLQDKASRYSGFNLLVADEAQLWSFSNRGGAARRLDPGVYGLANYLLDDPGLGEIKAAFAETATRAPAIEALFSIVSAARIVNPTYGTRCSTVWRRSASGQGARYAERSYRPDGSEHETLLFEIDLPR